MISCYVTGIYALQVIPFAFSYIRSPMLSEVYIFITLLQPSFVYRIVNDCTERTGLYMVGLGWGMIYAEQENDREQSKIPR